MFTSLVAISQPAPAAADPCAAVDVSFARGRDEPPGLGRVGQAFVDALGPKIGSMNVYAVDYSAGLLSTGEGADDLRNHLSQVAASCPNTKFVIGGYSMGATVVNDVAGNPPPDVAGRIRGIATFGNIDRRGGAMTGPLAGRWIDQCNPGDPVCQEGGRSWTAHQTYEQTNLPAQAASFVAGKL
ncbi:cutinase family protein [Mycobacteroides franklinii]|nr:cutinase family protein [Mycobacteroides franklinii]ORA59108.1 cutinase [Mycobacteroides franklinii]TDZ43392.1 Cutinase [Mycobacteroides franklinii]TDZ50527.1 Cutinase [Mycobacteroides franklinii]TDZ56947.1 Cutinase [Mycobacteroides franklinii]TDZ63888.1 Cutinase [Mycobacteroides franklinii]